MVTQGRESEFTPERQTFRDGRATDRRGTDARAKPPDARTISGTPVRTIVLSRHRCASRRKAHMTGIASPPDIDALKARLKATWEDGNYDYFSRFMEASAVQFLDRIGVTPGSRWLDVACGSGQLALIAARRGARVTGCDIATNAIVAARGRAVAEGLQAQFDEGDAEALPYADASFDVVATIFGAMFAPRPDLAAAELLRV